ncbi:L,D-transpeptidase family protein [Paenibacillus tianjinensis]|uniref:L,D-transpeptidase family protein n=1 Tax=Paenibacillus tianjinensis TaxID=2810347 RepID=A0ABX7LDC3_9BACL|nr:L,D-transpeptidase family protein [Paenibacillus tianjinensis]QSF45936.1 L,D-transpeptidase family protein [Paenibacillus tianjinensis]
MSLQGTAGRTKAYSLRSIVMSLVFLLLFTACFTGAASAGAASAASKMSTDLIIVNKKTNKLGFFRGGKLEKVFPVATGKTKNLTPEGTFRIVLKVKNRPYYKEHIPGGDPANPLGDRWLGLEVNGTYGTTYAIHGNNNESSIGKYVSAGCIRMHNDDIHWLYPRVAKYTTVIITSSSQSMENIASKAGYLLGTKIFAGTFIINGEAVALKSPFVEENSRVYIPLREAVSLLGGSLSQEAGTGALMITIGGQTVIHKPLSAIARVNGKEVAMLASRNVDGRLYFPLGSLTQLFGLPFVWDANKGTVEL